MTVSDWPLSPLNRLAFIARVSAPPVAMSTRSAVASNLPPDRALTTNGPVRGKEREEKIDLHSETPLGCRRAGSAASSFWAECNKHCVKPENLIHRAAPKRDQLADPPLLDMI